MRTTAALFASASLLLLSYWATAQTPQSEAATASLDEWITNQIEDQRIPGLAIAVVDHDRIAKMRGYGLANVELQVETSEYTIFQTASVGKQFTAAAVLLLAEDGRLTLDDSIEDYLEEVPDAWRFITIRNLLNHTSGIRNYDGPSWDLRRDYTESELLEGFAQLALLFPPGTEWSYSNTGYVILGILISRITGAHWSEFVRERIFEPAGMTTAGLIGEEDIVPNRADGYRGSEGGLANQSWVSPSVNSTADGSLYVSAMDMARWAIVLSDDSILSDESRELMWTGTRLFDGGEVGYGFGWYVDDMVGRPAVYHTGNWQGFSARITRFTDDDLTIVLLANRRNAADLLRAITEEVLARYRPEVQLQREVSPTAISVSEEELSRYVGFYWLPNGGALQFSLAPGGLAVGDSDSDSDFPLLRPYDVDSFFREQDSFRRLIFIRDPNSDAVIGVRNPNGTMRGWKFR